MATNRLPIFKKSPPPSDFDWTMPSAQAGRMEALSQKAAHLAFIVGCLGLIASLYFRKPRSCPDFIVRHARDRVLDASKGYLRFLSWAGLVHCEFVGFEDVASWSHSLICANHPSILDALALFSKIPQADCVVGKKPLRDPLFSHPARMANYIPSEPPIAMMKKCRDRLEKGANVIIFPEGTRTSTDALNSFHDGFALAAIKAGATIRTVFIECNSLFLSSGFTFFKTSPGPFRFRLSTGASFRADSKVNVRDFSKNLEDYFRSRLRRDGNWILRDHTRDEP